MSNPFLVTGEESRVGQPLNIFGDTVVIKVSGQDTGGKYSVMTGETPPLGGPPLHVHRDVNETFYVLEGKFMFELDGVQHIAEAETTVQIPPGVKHLYQNVGDSVGRTLLIVEPAGLDDFFGELAEVLKQPGEPPMEVIAVLHDKFGMDLYGPPAAMRG